MTGTDTLKHCYFCKAPLDRRPDTLAEILTDSPRCWKCLVNIRKRTARPLLDYCDCGVPHESDSPFSEDDHAPFCPEKSRKP